MNTEFERTTIPQVTDMESITEGCNAACVTYGLDDNMNVTKMVILYDKRIINFENVANSSGMIMMNNRNIALCKSFVYSKKGEIFKSFAVFAASLFKTIFGFTANADQVHDCRKQYQERGQQW